MSRTKLIGDYAGKCGAWTAALITLSACLGIVGYLFARGIGELSVRFLTTPPSASIVRGMDGGVSTPLVGTLLLTLIGVMVAFPWALATAVYFSEYAGKNKLAGYFRLGIDVLAGLPTIVIAIFGLAVFSRPQFGFMSSMVTGVAGVNRAFGRSFLVAGVVMAIMILPYVIKTCEEALKAVPSSWREASFAMGATRWQTITRIVLPAASNGIATGVILGIGRIVGDTAIVWLTLGGTLRMTGLQPWWRPENWLSTLRNTGSTLTSYIYYASPAGEGNMASKAFGGSLVLVIIILLLNLAVDSLASRNRLLRGSTSND